MGDILDLLLAHRGLDVLGPHGAVLDLRSRTLVHHHVVRDVTRPEHRHRRRAALGILLAQRIFALADTKEKRLRLPASVDQLHLINATDGHAPLMTILAAIGENVGPRSCWRDPHTETARNA